MSPSVSSGIWFGANVGDDSEYRLCGDVNGRRVVELGVSPTPASVEPNAIVLARAGAKAIVVDPDPDRISEVRRRAEQAEVRVECHQSELPDLGFATSASVDVVTASHTLESVDDLPRLFRQVHRILKPRGAFVVAMTHPVAAMFDEGVAEPVRRYGTGSARSISELFMTLERSNFNLDVMHELSPVMQRDSSKVPSVLLLRARKVGD